MTVRPNDRASRLPDGFADLEPLVPDWAVATKAGRLKKRIDSTAEERQRFYDTTLPRMRDIIALVDQGSLEGMSVEVARLMQLALMMVEISMTIELQNPVSEIKHAEAARLVHVYSELDSL